MSDRRLVEPVLLVLLFFGPLVLAAVAFYGPWEWAPRGAHGELLEPPVRLPAGALAGVGDAPSAAGSPRGRWTLLYARSSPCTEACSEHVVRLHQVRLALAEDRDRVQIALFLAGGDFPLPPGVKRLAARPDDARGEALAELLGARRLRDGGIFVVDPSGRVVVRYEPGAEQKGILEDVERLLNVAVID